LPLDFRFQLKDWHSSQQSSSTFAEILAQACQIRIRRCEQGLSRLKLSGTLSGTPICFARLRKKCGFTQVEIAVWVGIIQALVSDYSLN
jgi:hypothetical protein